MGGFEQEKHLKPLIAGVLILILLGISWIYTSHQHRLERLDRKIESAQNEVTQFNVFLQDYLELEMQLNNLSLGSSSTTQKNLISTVEDATEKISARGQLSYVRPQPDKTREGLIEEGVEIKLKKLRLHQLVELLYQFDQSDQLLKVSQLRVRTRFDSPAQLDTSMTLSRFRETDL